MLRMRHNSKRYGYILASEINFTQACENKNVYTFKMRTACCNQFLYVQNVK